MKKSIKAKNSDTNSTRPRSTFNEDQTPDSSVFNDYSYSARRQMIAKAMQRQNISVKKQRSNSIASYVPDSSTIIDKLTTKSPIERCFKQEQLKLLEHQIMKSKEDFDADQNQRLNRSLNNSRSYKRISSSQNLRNQSFNQILNQAKQLKQSLCPLSNEGHYIKLMQKLDQELQQNNVMTSQMIKLLTIAQKRINNLKPMYIYKKVVKKIRKTLDIAIFEVDGQVPSIDLVLNLQKTMQCINNQSNEQIQHINKLEKEMSILVSYMSTNSLTILKRAISPSGLINEILSCLMILFYPADTRVEDICSGWISGSIYWEAIVRYLSRPNEVIQSFRKFPEWLKDKSIKIRQVKIAQDIMWKLYGKGKAIKQESVICYYIYKWIKAALSYAEYTKALRLESQDTKKIDSGTFSHERLSRASPIKPPRVKQHRQRKNLSCNENIDKFESYYNFTQNLIVDKSFQPAKSTSALKSQIRQKSVDITVETQQVKQDYKPEIGIQSKEYTINNVFQFSSFDENIGNMQGKIVKPRVCKKVKNLGELLCSFMMLFVDKYREKLKRMRIRDFVEYKRCLEQKVMQRKQKIQEEFIAYAKENQANDEKRLIQFTQKCLDGNKLLFEVRRAIRKLENKVRKQESSAEPVLKELNIPEKFRYRKFVI